MPNLSRRATAGMLVATLIAMRFGLLGTPSRTAMAQSSPTSEITAEQWMSEWMSAGKPVSGTLQLSRFKDPIYFLTQPIFWMPSGDDESLPLVEVPKGFVTDFASIPQIFWSLLRPDGDYAYPAIIHDYLYWTQIIPREKADVVFRLAMEDFLIDSPTALTLYNAVRYGGAAAWQSNADLKASGEGRILKRFPEDPRLTWAEWKVQPDVFVSDQR